MKWDGYAAWVGFFSGALISASCYYFASGRPAGCTALAPGLPWIVLSALVGAILCGTASTNRPNNAVLLWKIAHLLYQIFMILAILCYILLILAALQSLFALPRGWQLPL